MAIYKNAGSQKVAVFAYDKTTGLPKTGDAANITAYLSKDWGAAAAITDTNPTEMDATNMAGWYAFDVSQAETNAEVMIIAPKSATANVVIDQAQVFTENLAANRTGTVGSVTGAVGSVAGAVASVTAGVTLANDAISAAALSAAAIDEIIDEVIEGSLTLRQVLRILLAEAVGKAAGGGTTSITFRDNADTKNRIAATVDASGNRSAVTLDAS